MSERKGAGRRKAGEKEKEGNKKEKVGKSEEKDKREKDEVKKKERRDLTEKKKQGGRGQGRLGSAWPPAAVWVGGGRPDKVKVKLASYLIRKASVLHFSLSFCQDVAVAFLVL